MTNTSSWIRAVVTGIGIVAGGLAAASPAAAAICVWTGAGATNRWSAPANWANCGGTLPFNGDSVTFPAGAAQPTNQNDLGLLTLFEIRITGTGAGNVRYDISGAPVTVTGRLLHSAPRDALANETRFQVPITLGGAVIIATASDAPLMLGDIALAGFALTFSLEGSTFALGALSGAGSVTKIGGGPLVLAADGTYTGPTSIDAGLVFAQGPRALGAAGAGNETRVNRPGQLIFDTSATVDEALVLDAAGASVVELEPAVLVTLTGPVTLVSTSAVTLYTSSRLTISGAVTGPVIGGTGLTVRGVGGTLVLENPANALSFVTVFHGTLRSGAAGVLGGARLSLADTDCVLDLNGFDATVPGLHSNVGAQVRLGGGTLTVETGPATTHFFRGTISGSGRFVKTGPGTLELEGITTHTPGGGTTVNEGVLRLNVTTQPALAGPIVVNGGLLVSVLRDEIADHAAVTVNAPGQWSVRDIDTVGSLAGSGSVDLEERLTIGANGTSTTFSGTISGMLANRDTGITKVGAGTTTLTGVNTYRELTLLARGTLIVNGSLDNSYVRLTGGTLGGVGTVEGILGGPGLISPGTSPGTLHAGIVSLGASAAFLVELNGPDPGTGYDRLDLTDYFDLIDGPALQVTRAFGPAAGSRFVIAQLAAGHQVLGAFAGLPEGATLVVSGQPFAISYVGGDGNDVVLTALEGPPSLSIDDVTVTEGDEGSYDALFTVTLSHALAETVTVQYSTVNDTAASPADYTAQSGPVVFLPGTVTRTISVPIHGDRDVEPTERFLVRLSAAQGPVAIVRAEGVGTIETDDAALTYYFSEGATGTFFDEHLLVTNPNDRPAAVTFAFQKEGGGEIVTRRTIAAWAHHTLDVEQVAGLETGSASVRVTSELGLPLVVERSMFWDATYYGGHTEGAVEALSPDWLFAEGAQGFFDTFVLVGNPHATPAEVTLTFLLEHEPPIVRTLPVNAFARLTVPTGSIPELSGRAFGMRLHATQPVIAERAMYFGGTPSQPWAGGMAAVGVNAPSREWFLAEGATGGFFDTFILLGNPQDTPAKATLRFLLDSGETVTVDKDVPANGRLTVNIEAEPDPRLASGAVSTTVSADVPIVAERSMYWPGEAPPWGEGHTSVGLTATGTRWGLAEGRVGGAHGFHTYILLANPGAAPADVTVTYVRERGVPIVRTYAVGATSRFTIDVNAIVPELQDETFGTIVDVTNGVGIAVERSMYWDANGAFWAGGSNALAVRLP